MVDEVAWEISQIDPKKTIQVGSFRIDPQGNQNVREVSVFFLPALLFHPVVWNCLESYCSLHDIAVAQ